VVREDLSGALRDALQEDTTANRQRLAEELVGQPTGEFWMPDDVLLARGSFTAEGLTEVLVALSWDGPPSTRLFWLTLDDTRKEGPIVGSQTYPGWATRGLSVIPRAKGQAGVLWNRYTHGTSAHLAQAVIMSFRGDQAGPAVLLEVVLGSFGELAGEYSKVGAELTLGVADESGWPLVTVHRKEEFGLIGDETVPLHVAESSETFRFSPGSQRYEPVNERD
jgi:hypothetical protein